MEKIYLKTLNVLEDRLKSIKNTQYNAFAKVFVLVTMNMKYENIAFDKDLKVHPYILVNELIIDTLKLFEMFQSTDFLDSNKMITGFKSKFKEEKHKKLFNSIWDKYSKEEFQKYIDRYIYRIKYNNLQTLIKDKKCVDFGCGNGVFCFALLQMRAKYVCGIDFGEQSIRFANQYKNENNLNACFKVATVYDTQLPDNEFDFAIQNGVFHHLDDEDKAIKEIKRVLKENGWMWYYTDGENAISMDLWDSSVRILEDISEEFISDVLDIMGINVNKKVHLMDGLSATYRHTSYKDITDKLSKYGFGNFKRLSGGFETDFDLDVIEKDIYGREKFGEGDLRILCQLVDK